MHTEELIHRCKSITLKKEEEDAVMFIGGMKKKGERVAAHCLVGKILLNRDVNKDGLRYVMQQAWKTTKEIKVESLGDNIFVFKFAVKQDKKRVLTKGPWHFEKALIVLVEPCMVKETIGKLEGKIGRVEEVETDEEGECIGPFARVRISVDITKPLRRILMLKQEGEEDIVMFIKYERLPNFCFCYGLIGHQFRECIKYKGQPKEKLIYEVSGEGWELALPTAMKLVSWKVRGLGNPRTRLAIKNILHLHKPQLLFLCETKLLSRQANEECRRLNLDNCFAVSRTMMSVGLVMMWNSEITVNITSYSSHHIDAIIKKYSGKRWRCTGIYGHPEAQQKRHTWTLMRRLAGLSPLPWLCIGDFNEIMHPNEKSGGNDRNVSMISEFREVAYECNLIDVGQFGSHHIEERLDRALCSKDWGNFFQEKAVTNMVIWESDHNLLVMNVQEKKSRVSYDRRTFSRVHYEDLWTPYEGCKNIVKDVWSGFGCRDDLNPMQTFKSLSKAMMAQLQ
ncbi:hypothetical protein KPL71_011840 [Citrus sinensis]|uniref:Uncharacterized protein n=1 Tax=Citrus sinensis TaxID=2711 RepID=A0ACB8L6H0_CITSI|nr:hypothetical protein KPL71_011840 [Citrus sinensis]